MQRYSKPYAGEPIRIVALIAQVDQIARVERIPRKHRGKPSEAICYHMKCQSAGCSGDLPWLAWNYRGLRLCRLCRDKERTIHGFVVASKALLAQRHRILGAGRRPGGAVYFLTKCSGDGCESVRRQSSTEVISDKLCIHCWGKNQRRVPKWKRHYTTVMRGALRRHIPFLISFEWFLKTCEVQTCFYCRRSLQRVEYGTLRPSRLRVNSPKHPRTYRKANLSSYLDRISPEEGYVEGNLTMACWPCNKEKREIFTAKQWLVQQALRQNKPDAAIQIIRLTDEQIRKSAADFATGCDHPISKLTPRKEKAPSRSGRGVRVHL
jgi:hypothetical protein